MLKAVVIGQVCIHARMIEYIIICNKLINHCSKRRGCEQQYETWERQVCSRYVMEIVHYDGQCIDFDAIF